MNQQSKNNPELMIEGLSIQAKVLSMPDDPCDKIAFGMLSMINREDVGQMMRTNGLGKRLISIKWKISYLISPNKQSDLWSWPSMMLQQYWLKISRSVLGQTNIWMHDIKISKNTWMIILYRGMMLVILQLAVNKWDLQQDKQK